MFDYIQVVNQKEVLAIMSPALERDTWGIFLRPFHRSLWIIVICTAVILILSVQMLPSLYAGSGKNKNVFEKFHRFVVFLTWSFFVATEIYYEGALTMFFTTEIDIPFESIKDVMRAYPDWKLMMRYGNDVFYQHYVESGDSDYIEFWDRVLKNPKETVYYGIEQVVQDHEDVPIVVHDHQSQLDVHNKYGKPELINKLKVFYKGPAQSYGMIVTENSPLGPILRHGTKVMFERGVFDYLRSRWLGGGKDRCSCGETASSTNMVLGMNHMSLVIAGFGALLATCLATFFVELYLKHKQPIGSRASRTPHKAASQANKDNLDI